MSRTQSRVVFHDSLKPHGESVATVLVEVIALTSKSGMAKIFGGYEAGVLASGQHYSTEFNLCQCDAVWPFALPSLTVL